MNPRAMLTRCCSPPENVAGGRLPQPLGQIEPREQTRLARSLRLALTETSRAVNSGSATTSSADDARQGAQELADIADRSRAGASMHGTGIGGGEIDSLRPDACCQDGFPHRRRNCRRAS
jgi:hypothetical protein